MEHPNFTEKTPERDVTSKERDLKDKLELFGEDDVDFEKDFQYTVNIPKETTDNILMVSRLIRVATLTISGYEEQPSSDEKKTVFRLVKHPLASSEVIKAFESLLKPYADESNLVTKKNWDSFKIQALADWSSFYKLCLREKASPEQHERTVFRIFQAGLINIGEVTCDNPSNMRTLFGTINDKQEEDDARNVFK